MKPIIVIVGPTASGKSALAIKFARKYNGEIIAADSRTVYKGMDIATAKPSLQEKQQVPHFGLDLIEPDRSYSAAEFKIYATRTIHDIHERNRLPIVVGGTGLYVDGLVYDFHFGPAADPAIRAHLASLNLNELQILSKKKGIDPEQVSYANPRHLSRAIERGGTPGQRKDLPPNILMIGMQTGKEQLHDRIEERVGTMFNKGLAEEVKTIIKKYGPNAPGLLAPGYKAVKDYLEGSLTLEESKQQFIRNDKNLAKRQMTWFKRNKDIKWCTSEQQIHELTRAFLAKFATIES